MEIVEMNMCLSKFFTTARRKDGSYYKKSSLMSIRAALDRHLRSPPPLTTPAHHPITKSFQFAKMTLKMSDLVYLLFFASKKRFNALQNVIVTNKLAIC